MPDTKESKLKSVDSLRSVEVDIVFTHYLNDHVNPDYRTISRIVTDMSYLQQIKNIETAHKETKKLAALCYTDVLSGGEFMSTDYVDITDVMNIKQEAFLKHESQKANMTRMGTAPDILRKLEI